MDNLINDKSPLIFVIMCRLSSRSFLGVPTKRYFKSMTELYNIIGGKNGSRARIITDLKRFNIISKDEEGIFYDTALAKKLIKESILAELAENHDLKDIIG